MSDDDMAYLVAEATDDDSSFSQATRDFCSRDRCGREISPVYYYTYEEGRCWHLLSYRLVGLVVKASASRGQDPRLESHLRRDFSGSSHTSDLNIGTPLATLARRIGSALGLVGPVSVYCN